MTEKTAPLTRQVQGKRGGRVFPHQLAPNHNATCKEVRIMADSDYIDSSEKSEIAEISEQLNLIAARLSGFAPILVRIADGGSVDADVCNSLEVIGGMSEYLNSEICDIAARLNSLDKKAA